VFCILIGVALRWINLGDKVFWYDEVFTAVRVVGHTAAEIRPRLFTGVPFTAETLQQYQGFAPDSKLADTLRALAAHPEHPPLFYLLCWAWVRVFGTSIAAFRAVSAIASTLTFFALPLLAWELFATTSAAVIAPLLFAFSPVYLLYAQEARQYALWTLLIVLATWALRRAVCLGKWQNWGLYSVLLAFTFYTSVLSLFVMIAHGVYGLLSLPKRRWLVVIVSIGLAVLGFLPWLGVMFINSQRWQQATAWTTEVVFPMGALVKLWGLHFAAVFVDPNVPLDHPYTVIVPPLLIILLAGILVFHWRHLPPASSLLLLSLILVPTLCLIGGDLVRGSILSKNTRYFMPALIGALVAVAGWLGAHYRRHPKGAVFGLVLLLSLQFVNALAIAQASTWWNKSISYQNQALAAAIRTFPDPVILAQNDGTTLGNLLSLSHYLPSQTQFVVTAVPDIPQPPPAAKTVLLFQPSAELLNEVGCPVQELPVRGGLFQVSCR